MCADSRLNCTELHWTAPGKLAVQPSPWIHLGSYRPIHKGKSRETTEQHHWGREKLTPRRRRGLGSAPKTQQTNSTGESSSRQRTALRQKYSLPLSAFGSTWRDTHRHEANKATKRNRATKTRKAAGEEHEHRDDPQRRRREEPGGSTGQGEKGHTRTRGGARVP